MAEFLSAGVKITEIDAGTIVPTVSNSIGVFAGNFSKGPVGAYTLITSVTDLISFYGLPTNTNYNDWYQAYNFLQYGNKLLVSRAANVDGIAAEISGITVSGDVTTGNVVAITGVTSGLTVGNFVAFEDGTSGGSKISNTYEISSIVTDTSITLDRNVEELVDGDTYNKIFSVTRTMNGVFEATSDGTVVTDYLSTAVVIENATDFETKESTSITFNEATAKLKIIARSTGAWSSNLEVAIALPSAFGQTVPSLAFDGISLDSLYEYVPTGTEVALIVKLDGTIVETWNVDFDENAKDFNNKSNYIENVINSKSSYIFVKDNTANTSPIENYIHTVGGASSSTVGSTISLALGLDSEIVPAHILNAYDLFLNKEELDIDIVIANETNSSAVVDLVEERKDCIGFIGATYSSVVGQKSALAVGNLIEWRKGTGAFSTDNVSVNSMFAVACGNYKYQYDRYNDKYRWVNIAGDIAGLRAQTSMNRASWWASAGLERGQVKNVTKLAFNPTQGQRDLMYKNSINPIVSFPGQGTVMFGQKTLLSAASSFDRVNVRGLFNTMERALGKMAKFQVMEFNDNFTRNRIVSMIKPYLSSVQAGRGIQDFLVVCDESNNTSDVISRNQLVVDIYIKPTFVAEFIQLRFTNAGTNSFAEVIGG
jgi:phage tail sheath protein FI